MFRWFSDKIFQCVPLLFLVVAECCGHVVLTYPPARMYPLDFLNNMDTPAPCGMPRDPSLVHYTDLQAGSNLQVFWDIAYPHRGGLYMELLNHNNEVLQRHPPEGQALADDVSQLNYTIQLPQESCINCTLRIVKRGLEWGDNLLFWSCSDINLVTAPMTDRQQCSNHGTPNGTQCVCDRMYDGEICQFQNDCEDASDCNNHGQCVDTEAAKYPRQVCFCSPGWFGRFCERESPVKSSSEINLLEYTQRNLSNNFTLYHRILQDSQELEVVLVAKSVTWIAVGWRSKDANKTCKGFPVLNFGNDRNVSSHDATTPGSILPPEPTGPALDQCNGSCNLQSGCLYNVTWVQDPSAQTVTFTVRVELLGDEYFGLGFSRDNEMPNSDIVVGWVRSDGGTFLSDRWATARVLPEADSQNDLSLVSGQIVDGVTVVSFSRALDTKDPKDQALIDSECIYLLTARGQKTNDDSFGYHSQKRPSLDKFCFNKCHGSMVSEAVTEPTGRDSSTTSRVPDSTIHDLDTTTSVSNTTNLVSDTTTSVSNTTSLVSDTITSVSDTTTSISNTTTNATDTTTSISNTTTNVTDTTTSIPDTTIRVPDGEGSTGGGSEPISNSCDGSCNLPSGCLYNISWTYDPATDRVNFSVAVQLESTEYFGLGFSEDQFMPDSDIAVGWVRSDGRTFLSDRWASARAQPVEDSRNDLTLISGQVVNGVTSVMFSRAVVTSDPQDLPLNVTGCIYLLTAKGIKTNDDTFGYHSQRRPSLDKFCFNKCRGSMISGQVTEPSRRDSSTTNGIPNAITNVPDAIANVPDTTTILPDTTTNVNNVTTNVPGATTNLPGATTNLPGATTNLPDVTTNLPDVTTNVTDTTTNITDTTNLVPGATTNITDATNLVPNTTTEVPDTTNLVPNTTTRVSDTTNRVPDGEGNTSGGSELMPDSCDGSCSVPSDCLYNVSWTFDPATNRTSFSVAVQLESNEYFGLGFSLDQFMPNSDIIIGWVRDSGSTYLSDRWATDRIPPELDAQNDLTEVSGQIVNGITMVTFSRLLDTRDSKDQALNVPECIYLLTSVGVKVDEDNSFSRHSRRMPSTRKYCFSNCQRSTVDQGGARRRKRADEGGTTGHSEPNSEDNLQPMDCTDLVIGSARGDLSRVADYYTRDRSTPLHDEVYGGSNSLTAAIGFESDGVTTILFRKKLQSTEMTDWSVTNELMHVIWARGQQVGEIYHSPESAYERNEMSERDFYKPDVLKYHGSNNRGMTTFNFFGADVPATLTTNMAAETGDPDMQSTTSATVSSIQPGSTPSGPATSEESSVIVVIPSSIRLVNMNYSQDLSDLSSPAAQQMKVPIENELNRKLTENVMRLKTVVITRFSPGSVVVDFDVRVESKDTDKEEVRQYVENAMVSIVKEGTLSGHTLDKDYLVIGESRTEQITGNETEKEGLGDVEIIVIVVVIVVCLVIASFIGYKIWTRKKAKSSMNQTRNGNGFGSSYVGSNGDQSHAEMQESSRNSKEDDRWSNKQEPHQPRSYDNGGYDTSPQQYQTYVA